MRGDRRGNGRAKQVAANVALGLGAMLAACKGTTGKTQSGDGKNEAGSEASTGASDDAKAVRAQPIPLTPACASALSSLVQTAPEQRAARLLTACQPCGAEPILIERRGLRRTTTYFAQLDAAIAACGGFCTKAARTDFLRSVQAQLDDGEPSARPWRALAEACPAELGWRDASRGFVGATWFVLERVALAAGRELPGPLAAAKGAPFPLPAVAAEGRGLQLPSIASVPFALQVPGRIAVTVLAAEVMVGRLPWATMTAAGVQVDGQYPGVPATRLPNAIAAAEAAMIAGTMVPSEPPASPPAAAPSSGPPRTAPVSAPSSMDPPSPTATREDLGSPPLPGASPSPPPPAVISIAAPHGLPARRVAEVIAELARPARLLVLPASTLPEYQPPMVLPPVLIKTPPSGAPQISISDAAAVAATAKQLDDHQVWGVALALEEDSTVEQLAAALAQLHSAVGVALVVPPAAKKPPGKP